MPELPKTRDSEFAELEVVAESVSNSRPQSELMGSQINSRRFSKTSRLYTTMLLFELGLGVLALGIGFWLESPSWRTWDWSPCSWWLGVLGTIPPLIMLLVMLYADWDPLARFRTLLEKRVAPIFAALNCWQLLLLAAAAGWGEELLFRGLLQPLLCQWLGTWTGIIVLAFIFGMAHALSPLYFALTMAMSVYFSWLLESTGNLTIPILVHGFYDAVALLIMHKEDR
jgi:membrane protease YdiL (CAAX protease family)